MASTSREDFDGQSKLPAIMDGKFFTVVNRNGHKIVAKCMLCPNRTLMAQIDCTSNLIKHLKVNVHACELDPYYSQIHKNRKKMYVNQVINIILSVYELLSL